MKECKNSGKNNSLERTTYMKDYYLVHKEDIDSKHKIYRIANKEILNLNAKNFYNVLRQKVLKHYGNKCECCRENILEFLCIDHINGNGNKHRKEIGRVNIYWWLNRNNFPKGFRILCYNCNNSIGKYKYCPHEKRDSLNA